MTMKTCIYIIVCLMFSFFGMGCISTTFSSTRVGPNRFTVTSHGQADGPENYSRLLAQSYETCIAAGFKDYSVAGVARESRRVVFFIRCEDEKQPSPPIPVAEEKKEDSSFLTDLQSFYESAKKKWQETNK